VKTCDPPVALSPAPAVLAATAPATFVQFSPSTPFWTPVAVRPDNVPEDWDLFTYSTGTGGGAGTCFTGALANSSLPFGKTDYVVGDFNYNPLGTYYAIAQHWTGIAGSRVQWFPGAQSLPAGGAHAVRTTPGSFLVESWDALLVGGAPYTLLFSHDVAFDVKASVFPSMGGVRWVGRGGALFETGSSVSFTAPSSGWAGIVVVSDGGAGSFDIALANGTLAAGATPPPASDALGAISPNPGRGGMRFDFALHDPAAVSFEVMDMAGRVVSRLEPLSRGAGSWSEAWTARDARGRPLAAGLYFVRMRVGDRTVGMRKLTLLE
jgi:hypothetical protein